MGEEGERGLFEIQSDLVAAIVGIDQEESLVFTRDKKRDNVVSFFFF